jgi:superfamily II DNA/RNA helicase
MSRFKNRSLKILIGTDIISRGIDVVGIELVINFDTPNDPEDYVHRVGRTARADSKGEAITFVNDKDLYKFKRIESLIGMEIEKIPLPEGFEKGPDYKGSYEKSGKKPWPQKTGKGLPKKKFSKKRENPEKKQRSVESNAEVKEKGPGPSPSKYGNRSNVIKEE